MAMNSTAQVQPYPEQPFHLVIVDHLRRVFTFQSHLKTHTHTRTNPPTQLRVWECVCWELWTGRSRGADQAAARPPPGWTAACFWWSSHLHLHQTLHRLDLCLAESSSVLGADVGSNCQVGRLISCLQTHTGVKRPSMHCCRPQRQSQRPAGSSGGAGRWDASWWRFR